MKSSSPGRDVQTILEAVKSSEVVENRILLLKELGELDINEKFAVKSLIESLTIYWEDFTCLDISQCILNKTILHVAEKYLETDISEFLPQFIMLGTKANIWCKKHLQMTLMSMEDSPEEEHSSCFYQLVLDLLRYSASSYSALSRYHISIDNELVLNLESFISEQFTMMKDLVSEIKRIEVLGSELLKAAQETVVAVTRLCKIYCDGVNWETYKPKNEDESIRDGNKTENGDHVIHVTNCTVNRLCELGTAAANDGGSLVNLLNYSWKGVVSLLQCGKGSLAAKVNILGVILNLISLASDCLRHAAKTWSSSLEEKVSVADAKRIFLPVKFYLINAVRIISQYQTQALMVYKEITLLVVTILTFRISLGMTEHLKSASEVLSEILEPTSLHLLNSLLNSAQVKQEDKFEILDWLCSNERSAEAKSNNSNCSSLELIFSLSPDAMNEENILDQGRVALFLTLLTSSPDLDDDMILGIARKLGWLLDILVDEEVYCSVLVLQVPSSQNNELTYQPMFSGVLHALKTFTVTVSSSAAWKEVESFLIENLFHPHILCWDIVSELWCFILRHAEPDMVNDITDKLCTLLMQTSGESMLFPDSALRKTARVICSFVAFGPEIMADRVWSTVSDGNVSQHVYTALLMEGFSLNSLSEKKRSIAKQRIVTQYYDFLERIEDMLPGKSAVYGAPVFALCAALQSLQVSLSDTDMKTLKFLVTVIRKYKSLSDNATKDDYRRVLGELLGIISNMKHLYSSDEIEEVILEIHNLFISKPAHTDSQLFLCKPNLAQFMAGVGHVELTDGNESARSTAALELYHMLLKERHWALVHLAVTAFGYFASHTSFNQLWRFVPHDAALSFDLESGNEAEEERFMEELKAVLEKEMASLTLHVSPDQISVAIKEGRVLKDITQKSVKCDEEVVLMNIVDDKRQVNKKRKFPDGISRGVEVVQSGLKIMVDGLSEWQNESSEVRETFLTHFDRLRDEIAQLATLANTS